MKDTKKYLKKLRRRILSMQHVYENTPVPEPVERRIKRKYRKK